VLLELELPDLPDFPLELPPDLPDLLPPDFPLFPLELLVEEVGVGFGSGLPHPSSVGADHPSSFHPPSSSCLLSPVLNEVLASTLAAAANAIESCIYETFIVYYCIMVEFVFVCVD